MTSLQGEKVPKVVLLFSQQYEVALFPFAKLNYIVESKSMIDVIVSLALFVPVFSSW